MSTEYIELEGTGALLYTALWQTRELGFLKPIMEKLKIRKLKVLFYFKEYMPGALVILDGELGDFTIQPVESLDGVEYDGAVIGKLKPIMKALENHIIMRGLWTLISGKVKLKGIGSLLKFAKILIRGAI